ncbi:MAG: DUF5107 domain-containing protein [Clostridia bacterium]|nr:DUF5107 domain-containing protein [Clostridia bacterium]
MEIRIEKKKIPTYPEAKREELPMFAENRVHQRTSGNPFPNKIVVEAQRKIKRDEEYTVVTLANDYIELAVIIELGGKIWYAKDKKSGYEFIYKNNIVKPALIGVLGSWTSGGMEFNWPFHHRASTFMPVDYRIEKKEDEVTLWLSEHDPIDRMKGMVGVSLKEGESIFETKVKLDNVTPVRRSFLWWENTAVPVNENYEIFFPEDVNYVCFHYKRSVTTYPIANNDRFGAFNGIYYDGDTEICKHKNTRSATSYFSADSKYDYFGGYDNGKRGGIVHIADHHISPGKKMFTWAYGQLSKTWENALTDTDGQYAELMAGCYSDNQPDLSWIMPNETKRFSQKWYPIHDEGAPTFANDNFSLYVRENSVKLQAVRRYRNASITIGDKIFSQDIPCYDTVVLPQAAKKGERITVTAQGEKLLDYVYGEKHEREIPEPRKEYPYFKDMKSANDLYTLGTHVAQYRSPDYRAENYYKEALIRDEKHVPSLVALAEEYYAAFKFDEAKSYIDRAENYACAYNTRNESGRLYYAKGLILYALGDEDTAYDYFYKAYFAYDYKAAALLRLGMADVKRGDIGKAKEKFAECLSLNAYSPVAAAYHAYAEYLSGNEEKALSELKNALMTDGLNLYALAFKAIITGDYGYFLNDIKTDLTQDVMDICAYLHESGLFGEIAKFLCGVNEGGKLKAAALYLCDLAKGEGGKEHTDEGIAFPSRVYEMKVLKALDDGRDMSVCYYLGNLFYGRGNYVEGLKYFLKADGIRADYRVKRNLAAAYYSHFGDTEKAKKYMREAVALSDKDEKQMTFEYAYFLGITNEDPAKIVEFINSRNADRDEICVELARAYNRMDMPDAALATLLKRNFVACEGGEHYIADQYMYAYYLKGKALYENGRYEEAAEEFTSALTLPQSLGSGLWNEIKKTPYLYFAAMCYDKLGLFDKAKETIKKYIHFKFDYFTNMYLYTYRYYLARAYEYLGEKQKADELIKEGLKSDLVEMNKEDAGYFSTTPFFISFIDDNKLARENYFSYRLYLYYKYLGDEENSSACETKFSRDGYKTYIKDFVDDKMGK